MPTFENDYSYVVASDLERDGMYLEVSSKEDGADLLEIFFSDRDQKMTVTTLRGDVPVEVVEWAISIAKHRLMPS